MLWSICFLSLFLAWAHPALGTSWVLWVCMGLVGVMCHTVVIHKLQAKDNWLTPDIVFSSLFVLGHFGATFLLLLRLLPYSAEQFWDSSVICPSVCLATAGLAAFLAGYYHQREYSLDYATRRERGSAILEYAPHLELWHRIGRMVTWFGMGLLVVFVYCGGENFLGTYSGTGVDVGSSEMHGRIFVISYRGLVLMLGLIVPLGLLRSCLRRSTYFHCNVAAWFVLAYSLLLCLHGDRNGGLVALFVLFAFISEISKPFNARHLFAMSFLCVAVFFLMGAVRHASDRSIRSMTTAFQSRPVGSHSTWWTDLILEVGSPSQTLNCLMSTVPSELEFGYGRRKTHDVVAFVPLATGIFGDLDLLTPTYETFNSANLATDIITGGRNDYGAGTSIVADAYVDFGRAGVVVSLFGLGLFSRFLQEKARAMVRLRWWIIYAAFVGSLACAARYTLLSLFENIPTLLGSFLLVSAFFGLSDNLRRHTIA